MALKDRVQVKTPDATLRPPEVMGKPIYTQREFRDQMWTLADKHAEYGVTFADETTELSPLDVKRAVIQDARDAGKQEEVCNRLYALHQDASLPEPTCHAVRAELSRELHTWGRQLHCQSAGEEAETAQKTLENAVEVFMVSAQEARGLPEDYAGRANMMACSLNETAIIQAMTGNVSGAVQTFEGARRADPTLTGPLNNCGCIHYGSGNLDDALTFMDEELTGRRHAGRLTLAEGGESAGMLIHSFRNVGGELDGVADALSGNDNIRRDEAGWSIVRGVGDAARQIGSVTFNEAEGRVELQLTPGEGGAEPLTVQLNARRVGGHLELYHGEEDATRDNPLARNNRGVIHSRRIDRAIRSGASDEAVAAILTEARADFNRADELLAGGAMADEGGAALQQIVARNRAIVEAKASGAEAEIPPPIRDDLFDTGGVHVFALQEEEGSIYEREQSVLDAVRGLRGNELFSLSCAEGATTSSSELSASLQGMGEPMRTLGLKIGSRCTIQAGADGNFKLLKASGEEVGTITYSEEDSEIEIKKGMRKRKLSVVKEGDTLRVFSGNPKHARGLEALIGCEGGAARVAELVDAANSALGGNPLNPRAGGYILGQHMYQNLTTQEKTALEDAGFLEKPTTPKFMQKLTGPPPKTPDFQEIGDMFQEAAVILHTDPQARARLDAGRSRSMLLQNVVEQTRTQSPFYKTMNIQGAQTLGNLFLASGVIDDDELTGHAQAAVGGERVNPDELNAFKAMLNQQMGAQGLRIEAMRSFVKGFDTDGFWAGVARDFVNIRNNEGFVTRDQQGAALSRRCGDLAEGDTVDMTVKGRRQNIRVTRVDDAAEEAGEGAAEAAPGRRLITFNNGTRWNVASDQNLAEYQSYARQTDSTFAIFNSTSSAEEARESALNIPASELNPGDQLEFTCTERGRRTLAIESVETVAADADNPERRRILFQRDPALAADAATDEWILTPPTMPLRDFEEGIEGFTIHRITGAEEAVAEAAPAATTPRPEESHELDEDTRARVEQALAVGGFAASLNFSETEWETLERSGIPPRTARRVGRAHVTLRGCSETSMAEMGAPAGMDLVYPEPTLVPFDRRASEVLSGSDSDETLCAIAYSQEVLTRARTSTSHTYYILLPENQARELHERMLDGRVGFTQVFDEALPEAARGVFAAKRLAAAERETHATPERLAAVARVEEERLESEEERLREVSEGRGGGAPSGVAGAGARILGGLRDRLFGRRGAPPPGGGDEADAE
ncbi:MAG: hypothetical protein ABH834_08060 [Candidatus Altiarchaeota archaeon]